MSIGIGIGLGASATYVAGASAASGASGPVPCDLRRDWGDRPTAAVKAVSDSWFYRVRVLRAAPARYVVLVGESHAKPRASSALAQEMLRHFPIRGVEGLPMATQQGSTAARGALWVARAYGWIFERLGLVQSTIVDAMQDSVYVSDEFIASNLHLLLEPRAPQGARSANEVAAEPDEITHRFSPSEFLAYLQAVARDPKTAADLDSTAVVFPHVRVPGELGIQVMDTLSTRALGAPETFLQYLGAEVGTLALPRVTFHLESRVVSRVETGVEQSVSALSNAYRERRMAQTIDLIMRKTSAPTLMVIVGAAHVAGIQKYLEARSALRMCGASRRAR